MAIEKQFKIPVIGLDITRPLIGKSSSSSLDKIIKTGFEHIVINITKNGVTDIKGPTVAAQICVTYMLHLNYKDVTPEIILKSITDTYDAINLPNPRTIVLHCGPDFTGKSSFVEKWKIFKETINENYPDANIGFSTSAVIDRNIADVIAEKVLPDVLFVDGYVVNTSFIELCKENRIDIVSMLTGTNYNIKRFVLFSKKYDAQPYHIIMRWMIQQQGIKIVIMDKESIEKIIKRDYLKVNNICIGPKDFGFMNKYLPASY